MSSENPKTSRLSYSALGRIAYQRVESLGSFRAVVNLPRTCFKEDYETGADSYDRNRPSSLVCWLDCEIGNVAGLVHEINGRHVRKVPLKVVRDRSNHIGP